MTELNTCNTIVCLYEFGRVSMSFKTHQSHILKGTSLTFYLVPCTSTCSCRHKGATCESELSDVPPGFQIFKPASAY